MQFDELSLINRESFAWSMLDGETIFMTGATGFFGTSILYSILRVKLETDIDINFTILTRNISSFKKKHPALYQSDFINCIQGDVVNFNFPSTNFSKIIHLATTSASETFSGEDQLNKYKMLTHGTERVMQFAQKCGAKKVLFTSSGIVYGGGLDNKVTELSNSSPKTTDVTSALGHGKRSAEFLVAYYADKYNIDYVIARCFSFSGPGLPLDIHYAIGNFVNDALTKDRITVVGDGSQVRSYLDIKDTVVWLITLLANDNQNKVYNVGSDQDISIKDLAYLVRDTIDKRKPVEIIGNKDNSILNLARNWYVPNIDRIKKEFNLSVWTSLEQSITSMIKELQDKKSEFPKGH